MRSPLRGQLFPGSRDSAELVSLDSTWDHRKLYCAELQFGAIIPNQEQKHGLAPTDVIDLIINAAGGKDFTTSHSHLGDPSKNTLVSGS